MRPVVEAALEVLAAGAEFGGLRRALFATVASRYLNIDAADAWETVDGGEGLLPLDVLLARLPTSTLASVATINKGRTGIKDAKPGQYPLVVTAEERGTSDHFDFEGPGVMIPTVSSTGHGDASLKRVHFQDGQYAVGSILAVVQPRDPNQLSARYLHAYLSSFKDELLVSRMVGTANVSLTVAKICEVPVPLLPIDAQRKVDELMALCDRLEARQQDAEAAHARLVQALLDSLTQARNADEFQSCWKRVAREFDWLFTSPEQVDRLKAEVIRFGVDGRLSHANSVDGSTPSLGLRREVALASIAEEIVDCPHSTPKWTDSGEICVRTSQFKPGSLDISTSRFVSRETFLERIARLEPRAGDVLYSREGGILGVACRIPPGVRLCLGQRMMLIRPSSEIDGAYLELVLNSPQITKLAKDKTTGGAAPRINVSTVRAFPIPVPSLPEQRRIVAKVTELLALCDQLKACIAAARVKQAQLAQTLVEQAVA